MTEHTPSPWEVIYSDRHARDGAKRAVIAYGGDHNERVAVISLMGAPAGDRQEHEANAKLIASAPDLQAENRRLREALERIATTAESDSAYSNERASLRFDRLSDIAKAALEGSDE